MISGFSNLSYRNNKAISKVQNLQTSTKWSRKSWEKPPLHLYQYHGHIVRSPKTVLCFWFYTYTNRQHSARKQHFNKGEEALWPSGCWGDQWIGHPRSLRIHTTSRMRPPQQSESVGSCFNWRFPVMRFFHQSHIIFIFSLNWSTRDKGTSRVLWTICLCSLLCFFFLRTFRKSAAFQKKEWKLP